MQNFKTAPEFALLLLNFRKDLNHENFVYFESKWEDNITNSAADFTSSVLKFYKNFNPYYLKLQKLQTCMV